VVKPRRWTLAAAGLFAAVVCIAGAWSAHAQDYGSKSVTLWVDPATGQLFTRPGKGRKPFVLPGMPDTSAIEHQVEQKVEQKTQQDIEQNRQQLKADLTKAQQQTQDLSQQMAQIRPAWQDYIDNFKGKFRVGTLVYADWRLYTHTGFGPQELTQINQPGPGNELWNSFDISRAYLNFFFNPTDDWTIRVTPNIYRTNGSASADKFGRVSAIGSNLSGNLGYRLKYGYLQYSKAFDTVAPLKGDTITLGQIPNPLVAWEEDLYGYRFVNLIPWNYLSLSSTQTGVSMQGPIKFNNLQYVDYDFGVYTNSTFHAFEQTNTKQVMGRVSYYPFGAQWRFDGLGLTGFYDYGYGNTTPDFVGSSPFFNAPEAHITRVAALLHYTAEQWGLAGEWDYGHNAFSASNLFSGSGPADFFGTAKTSFADFASLSQALLNDGRTVQQGFDFFGHYHIPTTPLTLFGFFEQFEPNAKVNLNPLDFQRYVAGVTYQYNEFLRFALASQNLLFYHNQLSFSKAEANSFAPVFSKATGSVADAVPRDNHMVFAGVEFSY
jgi:hypothetical protein